jgi:hypothetical protein
MASRYKIGLTVETLTSLDELATPLPDPQSEFRQYRKKVRLGNQKMHGLGPQTVVWEFPLLDTDQQGLIDGFQIDDPIYIQSPDKDEVDTIYEVLANIPDSRESGSHKSSFPGYRTGFMFEFTILSEVAGS